VCKPSEMPNLFEHFRGAAYLFYIFLDFSFGFSIKNSIFVHDLD